MRFSLVVTKLLIFLLNFSFAQTSKLVLKKSFPDPESEIPGDYSAHPLDMAISGGYCFVVDHYDHSIKQFTLDGQYVKTIGTEGRGPGELIMPHSIAMDNENDLLYCYDSRNSRISRFSVSGEFKGSMMTATRIYDIVFNKSLLNAAAYNQKTKTLFKQYNRNGEIVRTFGEFFDKRINQLKYGDLLYQRVELKFYNDSLYVSYQFLPIIHVYDSLGNFARSIEIRLDYVQKLYEHNIDSEKVVEGNTYHLRYLVKGISVNKHQINCFVPQKGVMITIDLNGRLIRETPIAFEHQGDKLHAFKRIYNDYVDNLYYFIAFTDAAIEIYEEVGM